MIIFITLNNFNIQFTRDIYLNMIETKVQELNFRLMLDASPSPLVLVNSQGKIAYVNCATEKLFQYREDELIGKNLETLLPSRLKKLHKHLIQDFFESATSRQMGESRELYGIKSDGSEFPVEIGLNTITSDDTTYVLAAIIDITDRKKRDQQFRLIVESIPNAIILVDSFGKISMINKRTETLFGYKRGELLGLKPERLIPERFNHNHHIIREKFFENPEARQMGTGRDLFAIKKNGSEFPVEIGLNPIETENGLQILVSIIDITQRKQFEEERKRYTRDIEAKNQELEHTEKKLINLNATKDKLFAIIGHDLRGPIGSSKSLINLILSDFDLSDTEHLTQTLEILQSTSNSTYELLEVLLEWAKSQQNEISFTPKLISFKSLVDKTTNLLSEAANKKSVHIHNLIPEKQLVYADENMLSTTIRNLISNAIKFTPENKNIRISISENNSLWTINVNDEGVGIKDENKHKIFNANESFTTFGTANEKGSGLGLLLCKEFVIKHGGQIWLESEVGKGSDFIFTLPKQNL